MIPHISPAMGNNEFGGINKMENEKQKTDRKAQIKRFLQYRGAAYAAGLAVLAAAVIGRGVSLRRQMRAALPSGDAPTLSATTEYRPTASPTLPAAPAAETAPAPETEAPKPVFENAAPTVSETEPRQLSFGAPLSGGIGDDYSMGVPVYSDTMGDYRTHNGVDFLGQAGEEVHPVAAGVVTNVKEDRLYGNTVTVDHGQGIVSVISGLADEGLIRTGMKVTRNSVLGVVGTVPVEQTEAPHIHLETRKDGALCDPLQILGLNEAEE